MNKRTLHIISGLLSFLFLVIFNLPVKAEEQIQLFPDRTSTVSGDTIWFNVVIFNGNTNEMSNVVHVQLDNLKNNHISKVSVICTNGIGEGYISVPDSLSTGVYVLKAFSFIQKSYKNATVNQRFVTIYNRFDEQLTNIAKPEISANEQYAFSDEINLKTEKDIFEKGEKVEVEINISKDLIDKTSRVVITAGLEDPFSNDFATSWYPAAFNESKIKLPVSMVEKNGVLISGKVHSANDNQPVPNAVVILSIPDSIPFFDYCVSDSSGIFYFYLRNAVGTADLVLQALAKNSLPCTIELFENYIESDSIQSSQKMIDNNEKNFSESVIKASYFTKLFNGYNIEPDNFFTMQREFKYTFYGEPTRTFYPDLFIDLPDFQEISREILRGVQYRERKEGITIRLLNIGADNFFDEEPLKLLDGIPVFNPEVFAKMGTKDIDRVDAVFYKRFYGDLSFSGVLSIYTKNRSLTWVDANPSTGHFKYPCLQPYKEWNFSNDMIKNTHIPNFNKVLYRYSSEASDIPKDFDFYTSDLAGNVVIRVILIQGNHKILFSQKLIKVE